MTKIIYFSLGLVSFLNIALNCKDLKEGVFKLEDHEGNVYTIIRVGNKQIEEEQDTGTIHEYKLKWIDDCNYILYDRKIVKGEDKTPLQFANAILYCRISKIEDKMHTVFCKVEGGVEIETPPIEKVK